jgi:hypothetical protein
MLIIRLGQVILFIWRFEVKLKSEKKKKPFLLYIILRPIDSH